MSSPASVGVAVLAAAAVVAWMPSRRRGTARLRWTLRPPGPPPDQLSTAAAVAATARAERRRVLLRRSALALTGLALASVVGAVPGLVVGGVAAVVGDRLLARLEPAAVRARRARMIEDLPALADLLAVTTRAGVPTGRALSVCADAVGGPLGAAVGQVATALALGAEPVRAWASLAADPVTAPLAVAMTRTATRGLAPAAALVGCAGQARRSRANAAARRAQAVAVWSAAPLGLCFLPAFVLVAVVPAVVGGLGQVLGSGF
jgi:Flp pilus assembly protein TadB